MENLIQFVRRRREMLSGDLAKLYDVTPSALLQAVRPEPRGVRELEITDRDFKLGRPPLEPLRLIAIMRAFVQLRGAHSIHKTVLRKLVELERKVRGHDDQLEILAEAIQELGSLPEVPSKEIGFRP